MRKPTAPAPGIVDGGILRLHDFPSRLDANRPHTAGLGLLDMHAHAEQRPVRDGLLVADLWESALDGLAASGDFGSNYMSMREANTIGADKYFHCKANCEAARRGEAGAAMAEFLSDSREWIDQNIKGHSPQTSRADQAANSYGRSQAAAQPTLSCSAICARYRPAGLDPRY